MKRRGAFEKESMIDRLEARNFNPNPKGTYTRIPGLARWFVNQLLKRRKPQ